jgi:hypothetical protein
MNHAQRFGHAADPLTTERLKALLRELERQLANDNRSSL